MNSSKQPLRATRYRPGELRDRGFRFRMTARDWVQLGMRSRDARLTKSEFLRRAIRSEPVHDRRADPMDRAAVRELQFELQLVARILRARYGALNPDSVTHGVAAHIDSILARLEQNLECATTTHQEGAQHVAPFTHQHLSDR